MFLLVLVVLAAASWWELTVFDPERFQIITTSKEGPDHFMEDFTSTTLDENGNPLHQLIAKRLTHFPNQEHSDLIEPKMTFYKDDKSTWVAVARQGKIVGDGKEVFLQGDVYIHRPGDDKSKVSINTTDLHIVADEDIAETPHNVVVQQDENTVTATGMFAHFGQGEVDLLSEVRGWYVN